MERPSRSKNSSKGKKGVTKNKGDSSSKKKRNKNNEISASSRLSEKHPSHLFLGWSDHKDATKKNMTWEDHNWIGKEKPSTDSVKIVSWNILATDYCYHHFYKHLKSPEKTLSWERRCKQIFSTVERVGADIYCFQEVDMYQNFQDIMAKFGYKGSFVKRSGHKNDGLAVFWRTERFNMIGNAAVLEYNKELGKDGEDRVAMRVCLQDTNAKRKITVCVTHLDYKRKHAQVEMAKSFALFCKEGLKESRDAIVACGDFNSTPQSEAVSSFMQYLPRIEHCYPLKCPKNKIVITSNTVGASFLDHMFYDTKFLQLVGIVEPFYSINPLPTDEYPSDHYLIGSEFIYVKDEGEGEK